jgi:hypothetical protein
MLRGAGGDLVGSGPGQPAGDGGGAGSMPQGQHGESAGTPEGAGRQNRPLPALHCCWQWPLLDLVSVGHLHGPPSAAVCFPGGAAAVVASINY